MEEVIVKVYFTQKGHLDYKGSAENTETVLYYLKEMR